MVPMASDIRVGVVGVGTIAATHLAVLGEFARVELSFVVDPDPGTSVSFKGGTPPSYRRLGEALAAHETDLVVITAPTRTHAALTREVLVGSDARALVEKPLAHDLDSLAMLRSLSPADLAARVAVAHHFAFSPEVRWAASQLARHPEWGPVTGITSAFHDPYITHAGHAFATYLSSWIDSGVNQLSMLARYVDLVERGPVHESADGATCWCSVMFHSDGETGAALLRASWQAVASSKSTTLELARSGVEIRLDHTAVTAFVTEDGQVTETLVNDGRTPRKIAHYRPLYESVLSSTPDAILGFDTAASVVELLHTDARGRVSTR
jgi:predicted dehydrogenase